MIIRILQAKLEEALRHFPVIGLVGSRQVGKTTLAKKLAQKFTGSIYLDLELPSDTYKLEDPELFLGQHTKSLIVIDEIQRMPALFPVLRALVDKNRRNGQFLLLGSASPKLIQHASESLAGRISYYELSPFSFFEVMTKKNDSALMRRLWIRGGYPRSFLASSEALSFEWREAFLKSHIERDIPQLGFRTPARPLVRFLSMAAYLNGQLWNAHKIAGSLGVSAPTVNHFLDIFEETLLLRRLFPYHANIKKRLVKSPKVFFRDSGLLHILLGQRSLDALEGHPSLGASWESFVIEQIMRSAPNSWKAFFYRTSAGAEIDLLLLDEKGKARAVEVKYSLIPSVSKGFWNALEDLDCKKASIVIPGGKPYQLRKNVHILPAANIMEIFE